MIKENKVIEYNNRNFKKIIKCKPVYLLLSLRGKMYFYGYRFTGKFVNSEKWYKEPLVYEYEDINGECPHYIIKRISKTNYNKNLTPFIYCLDKSIAENIIDVYNSQDLRS